MPTEQASQVPQCDGVVTGKTSQAFPRPGALPSHFIYLCDVLEKEREGHMRKAAGILRAERRPRIFLRRDTLTQKNVTSKTGGQTSRLARKNTAKTCDAFKTVQAVTACP